MNHETLKRWSFYFLSAAFVVGLVILVPAQFQFLSNTLGFYSIFGVSLLWLFATLGLGDKLKIPIRGTLDKIYERLESENREIAILSLTIACLLIWLGVTVAILGVRARQQYSHLILAAMESPDGAPRDNAIRQAFILIPWRKEAQILFEQRAYQIKDPQAMTRFLDHMHLFVKDRDVRAAVDSTISNQTLPYYLDSRANSFSDPALWFSNLLIERVAITAPLTEKIAVLEEAVAMLASKKSPEAAIQRDIFKSYILNLKQSQALTESQQQKALEIEKETDSLIAELQGLLSKYGNDGSVTSSITYQLACDTLGVYYLRRCSTGRFEDYRLAQEWFRQEIHERNQLVDYSSERRWQRPPDKLVLYFLLCPDCKGLGEKNAKNALDTFRRCYNKANQIDESEVRPESDLKAVLFSSNGQFSKFSELATWRKGTVLDDKVNDEVKTQMLLKGWSY